jgi:hypothetical protein
MAIRHPRYLLFSGLHVKTWKESSIHASWWVTSRIAKVYRMKKPADIRTFSFAGIYAAIGERCGQRRGDSVRDARDERRK